MDDAEIELTAQALAARRGLDFTEHRWWLMDEAKDLLTFRRGVQKLQTEFESQVSIVAAKARKKKQDEEETDA